jgi:hypothetical protein
VDLGRLARRQFSLPTDIHVLPPRVVVKGRESRYLDARCANGVRASIAFSAGKDLQLDQNQHENLREGFVIC